LRRCLCNGKRYLAHGDLVVSDCPAKRSDSGVKQQRLE
jgi:hypothetical protein